MDPFWQWLTPLLITIFLALPGFFISIISLCKLKEEKKNNKNRDAEIKKLKEEQIKILADMSESLATIAKREPEIKEETKIEVSSVFNKKENVLNSNSTISDNVHPSINQKIDSEDEEIVFTK